MYDLDDKRRSVAVSNMMVPRLATGALHDKFRRHWQWTLSCEVNLADLNMLAKLTHMRSAGTTIIDSVWISGGYTQ